MFVYPSVLRPFVFDLFVCLKLTSIPAHVVQNFSNNSYLVCYESVKHAFWVEVHGHIGHPHGVNLKVHEIKKFY